ncbi:MAG: serine/threonine protein kinase [bacterium]
MDTEETLRQRILELTGWPSLGRMAIATNTSDPMSIQRGDIIRLQNRDYVVRGNQHETRFGIGDQPKYWVFSAHDLDSGQRKILKTVFDEDFHIHIGVFRIHCYREPAKESRVLEMVRDDLRFMQGFTAYDEVGSNVRVLDFIRGETLFNHLCTIEKNHRDYFDQDLGGYLHRLLTSIEAIKKLHDLGTCHGDIRNDHIIIDADTGLFRWIDFDLNQHVSDFDIWSIGNVINYVVGKGITSFHEVLRSKTVSAEVKQSLMPEDGSAFYEYRIMNLGKLYPYLGPKLNSILRHFTVRPEAFYNNLDELLEDYHEMLDTEFALS